MSQTAKNLYKVFMNCLYTLTKIIMKKRSITEILSAMLNHFPQHLLLLHRCFLL